MYFNDKGHLIFDGYDNGKTVDNEWGDSDYEYGFKIDAEDVDQLYELFEVKKSNQRSLLSEIKKRFEGNHAYSKFKAFMADNDIDYSSSSWG